MSKNHDNTVEIPKKDISVEDVQKDKIVEETPTEEVIETESLGKKVLRGLRKYAPFVVIGGVIATAITLGRSSGSDAACLEMLEASSEEDDEDPEDTETDISEESADEVD